MDMAYDFIFHVTVHLLHSVHSGCHVFIYLKSACTSSHTFGAK